jgi:sodium/potassium-transporting ATPase subunit alpha
MPEEVNPIDTVETRVQRVSAEPSDAMRVQAPAVEPGALRRDGAPQQPAASSSQPAQVNPIHPATTAAAATTSHHAAPADHEETIVIQMPSNRSAAHGDEEGGVSMVPLGDRGGGAGGPSMTPLNARRSGSQAALVKKADGSLQVERRTSGMAEIMTAVQKRMSDGAMPTVMNMTPAAAPGKKAKDIKISAEHALEKTGGKGASGSYTEHMFPLDELANKFQTHVDASKAKESRGLTSTKAAELLAIHGPNVLTPPPSIPLWLLFLLQFTNLLMVLLQITAIACLAIYGVQPNNPVNLYIGVLLYFVIIATCTETFHQESKAGALLDKFRALVPDEATVVRDGEQKKVPAQDLVIGDIIKLKSGDKIPADCRVIYNSGTKSDQSMITGESEPVEVGVNAADPNALEARNIIFNGALVVDGECLAVVIRSGDATLIGSMVELTGDSGGTQSTLKADIQYFVTFLTGFALVQAAVVFIVGCVAHGLSPINVFINGFIVIMIGNVPQGLPTTVTACLFIVADRMGKRNVFVKKLDIIETLGSCTVICTDKTGTLTQNLMSVANMWFYNQRNDTKSFLETSTTGKAPANGARTQWRTLIDVAVLNSRVALEMRPPPKAVDDDPNVKKPDTLQPVSDATELGLYRYFGACIKACEGADIEAYRDANPKVHEIPFNSKAKWQMTIHKLQSLQGKGGSGQLLFIKGAPDVLLDKCSHYLAPDGSHHPCDEAFKTHYDDAYDAYGGNGERVLGFAMRPMPRSVDEEERLDPDYKAKLKEGLIGSGKDGIKAIRDLVFVGLITLQDPPRDEVPGAVADCHAAGIKVVMVTGDHPATAEAICKKIGLITTKTQKDVARLRKVKEEMIPRSDPEVEAVVVKGKDIPDMNEEDWKVLLAKKEIAFARTSPEQKLIIVKEFTKAGNVTAMTGDGVNDSPALKQAAIGVAMGLNGSDVAREAADLVLLDDNFASIVVGIKEGRLLFANLKKSIAYTLAHLVPEVVPVLLWAFAGTPQPMGSLLTLCIDLLTELVPATSLAYEEPESSIMKVPPRDLKKDKLTSFPLLFYAYGQVHAETPNGACFFFILHKY